MSCPLTRWLSQGREVDMDQFDFLRKLSRTDPVGFRRVVKASFCGYSVTEQELSDACKEVIDTLEKD